MSKVILFGTTEFAQVAYVYLDRDSPHQVVAFTVNEKYIEQDALLGVPVLPFETLPSTHPPDEYAMFVAMGYRKVNKTRAEVYQQCKDLGYRLISYINSKATHWGHIEVGDNTFIFEENVIQPFVTIGSNVIIWSGNHIGHHTTIGDHCFIASHAVISGNVTIGDYCFVGVNATFRDGVTVAPEGVIGAGAMIMGDTIEQGVYPGGKTRPIDRRSSELKSFQ